jgi:hypothetical protein
VPAEPRGKLRRAQRDAQPAGESPVPTVRTALGVYREPWPVGQALTAFYFFFLPFPFLAFLTFFFVAAWQPVTLILVLWCICAPF